MSWRELHSLQEKVDTLLKRTGLGQQLEDELEAEREARFRALAKRKGDALKRFSVDRDKCKTRLDAAEEKHKAAQKAAEAALAEVITANAALSTCHDQYKLDMETIEPQMLQCIDPRIAAFRRELEELLAATESLYRAWPDREGNLVALGFMPYNPAGRMSNNRAVVDRRARFIVNLFDEVDRLRLRHDVEDFGAEIDRLRSSIPRA